MCAVDGGPRATFSALFFHLSVIGAARNRARIAPWLCSRFSSKQPGACVTRGTCDHHTWVRCQVEKFYYLIMQKFKKMTRKILDLKFQTFFNNESQTRVIILG
jgi:hypothetical protein